MDSPPLFSDESLSDDMFSEARTSISTVARNPLVHVQVRNRSISPEIFSPTPDSGIEVNKSTFQSSYNVCSKSCPVVKTPPRNPLKSIFHEETALAKSYASPSLFSDDSILDGNESLPGTSTSNVSPKCPRSSNQKRRSRSTSVDLFSPTQDSPRLDLDVNPRRSEVGDKMRGPVPTAQHQKKLRTKVYPLFGRNCRSTSSTENESPLPPNVVAKLTSPNFLRNYGKKALEAFDSKLNEMDFSKPIRKNEFRQKMHGYECPCCKPYYDQLGLSPESRKQRVNQVSRHRAFPGQEMPPTPPRYWDVDFPSIEERTKMGLAPVVTTSPVHKKRERTPSWKNKSKAVRKVF